VDAQFLTTLLYIFVKADNGGLENTGKAFSPVGLLRRVFPSISELQKQNSKIPTFQHRLHLRINQGPGLFPRVLSAFRNGGERRPLNLGK